jgi:O-acetyl-ADP-ribose deacetylase (regulator of RNase III)
MPLVFISLNTEFTEIMRSRGYEAHTMKIQDWQPRARATYYVSPANSLCFMDGGIDMALSRIVFPGIESRVKRTVRSLGIYTKFGRPYLPIGSSVILNEAADKALVVAPTMLLPQPVPETRNAYWATRAILYNVLVNGKRSLDNVDILMTAMCCGYGEMPAEVAANQICEAIADYTSYGPSRVSPEIVVHEPNLDEQPPYYQNTEWRAIDPRTVVVLKSTPKR